MVNVVRSIKLLWKKLIKSEISGFFLYSRIFNYVIRYKLQKFFVSNLYLKRSASSEIIENTEEKIKVSTAPGQW